MVSRDGVELKWLIHSPLLVSIAKLLKYSHAILRPHWVFQWNEIIEINITKRNELLIRRKLSYIPEVDYSVPQRRGDVDQECNFSCCNPDLQPPGGGGLATETTVNCWWVCYFLYNWKDSFTRYFCSDTSIIVFHFFDSIIYVSIGGSEWKHLRDGRVNGQNESFRVASAHSPERLQSYYMLCLNFPAPLICHSNDFANTLWIFVFGSWICQARLLISLVILMLADRHKGKISMQYFFSGVSVEYEL